jgi:hypothetical protein
MYTDLQKQELVSDIANLGRHLFLRVLFAAVQGHRLRSFSLDALMSLP